MQQETQKKIPSPPKNDADSSIDTSEDVSSADLEENLDEIDLDEEYSTPF